MSRKTQLETLKIKKASVYGYIVERDDEILWVERNAKTALKIMEVLESYTGDFFGVCRAERRLFENWNTAAWKYENRLVMGEVVEMAVVDDEADSDEEEEGVA